MTDNKIYTIALKLVPFFKWGSGNKFQSFYNQISELNQRFPQYFNNIGDQEYFKLFCFLFFLTRNSETPSLKTLQEKLPNCGLAFSFYTDFDDVMVSCSECGGDGTQDCINCNSGEVECPSCDGIGYEDIDEEIECEECMGSGSAQCELCNGSGEEDCEECEGEGEMRDFNRTSISVTVSFIYSEDTKKYFSRLMTTSKANEEPMEIESSYVSSLLDEFNIWKEGFFEQEKDIEYLYNTNSEFLLDVEYDEKICGDLIRYNQKRGYRSTEYFENIFSDLSY